MQIKQHVKLLITLACMTLFVSQVSAKSFPEFTKLIEEKSPAVVKITALATAEKRQQSQQAPQAMPDNVPEIFRHFFDQRPMPDRNASATGSGFLISADGFIVTNNHVVEGADDISIRLNDRREYKAEVIGLDPASDLAVLKIDEKRLPYLDFANSDKAKVGEWVLAIGSPFGLDYSVSAGIISALGRSVPADGRQNYVPFIQTDVAINPGNSGGPLFDLDGKVVGINSQIYTRSGGSIGLSFAIPSNLAVNVVEQLKENGRVDRGWLGVVIQDVDNDLALSFGLDRPQGALISQMERGGPAENSGLEVGDVILEFNGRRIDTSSDLPYAVGPIRAGSTVEALVMRKGKKQTLDVTVGTRGEDNFRLSQNTPAPIDSRIGVVVEALSDEIREQVGMDGVVITTIVPDSPADIAGIQEGDVLVQLGFDDVASLDDFNKIEEALPANRPQPIRVIRNGSPLFRSLVIEQ